jgi:hypothetical protein
LVANSSIFAISILVTALVSALAVFQLIRSLPIQHKKRVYQMGWYSLFFLVFVKRFRE